jgi:hypothetical protein
MNPKETCRSLENLLYSSIVFHCNQMTEPFSTDSQMLVYKEDFKLERNHREKLQEEYQKRVDDLENTIRKLTTQLDACRALVEAYGGRGNAILCQSGHTPLPQVRFIYPYHPVDEIWQLEQQTGIIRSRNEEPMPLFYEGNMKPGYPEEL